MSTNVTEHEFTYGGRGYFRGNAHLLNLGMAGEKKDPIGPTAYIDPQRSLDADSVEKYAAEPGVTVAIDFSKYSAADVEANGSVKVFKMNINLATSMSYNSLKTADLKLVNFALTESELKTLINSDKAMFNYLNDEGDDARIVSEVWVVMEASLASAFEMSTSNTIAASLTKNNKLDVTANVSGGKSYSIEISKGTVFAYKLHKVKEYNANKKSDRTRVVDVEADYKGMS